MDTTDRPGFDQATRVAATATRSVYDTTSIVLHWSTVALVLALFVLSQTWGFFARPTRHLLIVAHMSFGIVLSVVIAARIAWRIMPRHQVEPVVAGWVERASKTVQVLLYLLLVAQAILGYVIRWAGNEAMSFFGLLIPPPFAEFSRPMRHLLTGAHEWIGWAIVIIALGHASAALYHHYVLRDNVLRRMLPGRRGLTLPPR